MQTLFNFFETLSPLSENATRAVSKICETKRFHKKELLHPIGHTCKEIYYIEKGLARVYYIKDGAEVTESFAFNNNIITRPESLFTGHPSKKGIQVLEDSEIVILNADNLFHLFDEHRDLERLFRKLCETALVKAHQRIESIQFCSAYERYNKLISEDPDIIQKVPLKHVASFLGVTPVSLSRIRAKK